MNKIFSTKERVSISLVGRSGSGKLYRIFEWLETGTFQPKFDNFFLFLSTLSTSLWTNAKEKP